MPLDGDDPGLVLIGWLRALDHAVLGPCDRLESRGEIADRLMVAAVHRGRAGAERAFEERSRFHAHGMAARLIAVGYRARTLALQILIQRAAQGDVENLDATTDRENRKVAGARSRDKRQLRGIAHWIDISQPGM